MVDRDQRLARGKREPLAGEQSDHHSADQPRAGRRRDSVDVANRHPGLGKHLFNQPGQDLDMGAGGNLRHHAAVGLVGAVLADYGLRQDAPVAGDERDSTVVAGRFKAQNNHFAGGPLPEGAAMH